MKTILSFLTIFLGGAFAIADETAIDIEVAMMPGVSITAPQEWAERLGKLGLDRVQIRTVQGKEKPSTKLNDEKTRLKVVALLSRDDELVLPDRKFRVAQLSELRAYFDGLAAKVLEEGIDRGPFGLTKKEFQSVHNSVSKPLGMSTKGRTSRDVFEYCQKHFRLALKQDAQASALARTAKPLTVELEKLSAGTALAIALRRDELTFKPVHVAGGLELVVSPYIRDQDAWPLGMKPDKSPRLLAPKLYEALTIEIDGYTLAKAFEALAPRLALPVVLDEWVLDLHDIRPAEIAVKLPAKKTFLKNGVDRLLGQARLASEVRTDDAGHAFLWITQYGPDSRPAY